MIRFAFCLLSTLLTASLARAQDTAITQPFPRIGMDDFVSAFNERVAAAGSDAKLMLRSCAGADPGRTCTFLYNSIAINLSEGEGTKDLQMATAICAKDCQPLDLAAAISASLYVFAPNLPKTAYGSWIAGATRAMKRGVPFETTAGPVRLTIPRIGSLGILAIMGSDAESRK